MNNTTTDIYQEKDYNNNNPPRIIIPVVFYHGADQWEIPRSFAEQFDVDDEVKRFLLDYRYILFDTNPWDFRDESNKELKKNVFLFTSMVLMKAAYKQSNIFLSALNRAASRYKWMYLL